VDFALASDVLPRSESHATDLGVWHMSWVLPTVRNTHADHHTTHTTHTQRETALVSACVTLTEPHTHANDTR
jgi:hypothetical protein